jgi:hypothetical protein
LNLDDVDLLGFTDRNGARYAADGAQFLYLRGESSFATQLVKALKPGLLEKTYKDKPRSVSERYHCKTILGGIWYARDATHPNGCAFVPAVGCVVQVGQLGVSLVVDVYSTARQGLDRRGGYSCDWKRLSDNDENLRAERLYVVLGIERMSAPPTVGQ